MSGVFFVFFYKTANTHTHSPLWLDFLCHPLSLREYSSVGGKRVRREQVIRKRGRSEKRRRKRREGKGGGQHGRDV